MGLFSKSEEVGAYEKVRPNLAEKDGRVHVVMTRSYGTWTTTKFHCDEEYTNEIDEVLQGMQEAAYEIVDVQQVPMSGGTGIGVVTVSTLITYR